MTEGWSPLAKPWLAVSWAGRGGSAGLRESAVTSLGRGNQEESERVRSPRCRGSGAGVRLREARASGRMPGGLSCSRREDQLRVLLCPALSRVNSNSKYTEGMQYASNVCVRNSNLLAFPRGLGNFSPPAGHPLRAERQPDQPDQSQPSRSGSLPTYGVAPWKEECPPGPEGGLAGTLSIAPFPELPSPPSHPAQGAPRGHSVLPSSRTLCAAWA